MKLKNVEIKLETLNCWSRQFLPHYDLFFFSEKDKYLTEYFGNSVLITTFEEFIGNSHINNFTTLNSYTIWRIFTKPHYVCIAHPDEIKNMEGRKRKTILKSQKECNRGLIYPLELVDETLRNLEGHLHEKIRNLLADYTFTYDAEEFIALQACLWNGLATEFKHQFLLKIAEGFVDDVDITEERFNLFVIEYPHINSYFNLFSPVNGPNCISATLAAFSKENSEWLLSLHITGDSFIKKIKSEKYVLVDNKTFDLKPKDIIIWWDEENQFKHTAFHLGDNYFFNKDGQTFFNPWQIVSLNNLYMTWGNKMIEVYRKDESL